MSIIANTLGVFCRTAPNIAASVSRVVMAIATFKQDDDNENDDYDDDADYDGDDYDDDDAGDE